VDPESKKLLTDTLALARENNDLLHDIRRSLRLQRIARIIYWVFIIGSAAGAYYFIQPYVDQVMGVYKSTGDLFRNFGN